MKTVLTIAGSDCSGGAGIQADIKTITAHKMYAMSAVTALTAQNTLGVRGILEVPPDFLEKQLDCIFTDIVPDAVKIGMVSNSGLVEVIAQKLKQYHIKNIVVDPVMVSTSGSKLLTDHAKETLVSELFPLSALITPNIPEAEVLCGFAVKNQSDMEQAAHKLADSFGGAVLLKGGHMQGACADLLYEHGKMRWFTSERVDNPNTHGTGCTLSSAIACHLAAGSSMEASVGRAKDYLTGAIRAMLDLGAGAGPLDHTYHILGESMIIP